MDVRKDILIRVYAMFVLILVLGLTILGRAVYIQTVEGGYWIEQGKKAQLRVDTLKAERGSIFSADGHMLSTSVPIYDIYLDPQAEGLMKLRSGKKEGMFRKRLDSLSQSMAQLFGDKTAKQYLQELTKAYNERDKRFVTLKKKISFVEFKAVREFPLVNLGPNKCGFIFRARDKRINPYGLMANRTIGIARLEAGQNVGLEQMYDSLLRGNNGRQLMRYISGGAYMPVEDATVEPENGHDIITNLDTYIQDVTENALMRKLVANNSQHGTAIVMETSTGKIRAIANLGKLEEGVYGEDLNYGVGKRTEPGSVFKLATLLCLMEDGFVDKNTIVDCEGGVKAFHGLKIKDSHLGLKEVTIKDAFLRSSNVAFAKLAYQHYGGDKNKAAQFIQHLHRLHLDSLTGVDLTASSGRAIVKKPSSRSWSATTIPYMAHGYEALFSPLHMLMLYNAVANGGKMMRPYLVHAVQRYGVTLREIQPEVLEAQIARPEVIAQLQECLRAVVDSAYGTARIIRDSAYSIAGKTGTAVSALNNTGYNKGNKIYQSSFIGYFPAERPTYTIAVVIQNTRESKQNYGGIVAAPVFKEISDRIYSKYLSNRKYQAPAQADTLNYACFGMKGDLTTLFQAMRLNYVDSLSQPQGWRSAHWKGNQAAFTQDQALTMGYTPDTQGMGLKDAVYILENLGFRVRVSGSGKVFNQSIAAGSPYRRGETINLILN